MWCVIRLITFNHFSSANEIRELNRKQLDEVQVRLSNSKHAEDLLNNEILQLKNEIITIQNKADENLLKEKNRADELGDENKAIQQKLDSFIDKEVQFFLFFCCSNLHIAPKKHCR